MTPAEELKAARAVCEDEFEPLWKPAPFALGVAAAMAMPCIDFVNTQQAARVTAFAWLAWRLARPRLDSFDQIEDLPTLRRAFVLIRNTTRREVARWADAQELAA